MTVSSLFQPPAPYNGGTAVAIAGTNLGGATAVHFGPYLADPTTITVVSSIRITVTAPAGSGVVDVRVFAGASESPIAVLDKFTYTTKCLSATIASDNPSPQPVGTLVTFTTTPVGCPTPMYTYWLRYPNGNWVNVRPWSSSSVWRWPTKLPLGSYLLHVGANQSGDSLKTFEALGSATFVVTKATVGSACTSATLNPPVKPSPEQSGTIITFTATASPCVSPEYLFYVQASGGRWMLAEPGASARTSGTLPGTE